MKRIDSKIGKLKPRNFHDDRRWAVRRDCGGRQPGADRRGRRRDREL